MPGRRGRDVSDRDQATGSTGVGGAVRRRAFLGGALASVAAASYARVVGANDRLRVALVGCGARGLQVTKALLRTGRVDLACLCDVYDLRRQQAYEALLGGGGRPFETQALEAVLGRADVDAVVLATPDHLHHPQALQVLAARKHLYLEKPATHRYQEGTDLLTAVAKSGVVCQTGTQQRSAPHYIRAKEEVVARGRLGKVLFARAVWTDFPRQRRRFEAAPQPPGLDWERFLGPAPKVPYHPQRYEVWRYYPAYGGGLLADILTHWADVAQWFLDDPKPLLASAQGGIYALQDGRENPDTVNAVIRYGGAGGWNLSFESTVLPVRMKAAVLFEGTEGTLLIGRDGYTFTANGGKPEEVASGGDLDANHAASFVDAVQGRGRPSAPIEIGLEACRPVHLAKEAYWSRRTVRFSEDLKSIVPVV